MDLNLLPLGSPKGELALRRQRQVSSWYHSAMMRSLMMVPAEPAGLDPKLLVESTSRKPGPNPDCWLMAWRICNLGQQSVRLLTAWLPHDLFRCEEQALPSQTILAPGETATVELAVTCHAPQGSIVENAFLMLRVLWRERPWRILIRLRVTIESSGAPTSTVEVVSTQVVGFSQRPAQET